MMQFSLPLVFLLSLFFPNASPLVELETFSPSTTIDSTCRSLLADFVLPWKTALNLNKIDQKFAVKLAELCHTALNCEDDAYWDAIKIHHLEYFTKNFSTPVEFLNDICQVLEVLGGPLGTCLNFIRDDYDSRKLLNCTWNSSDETYKQSYQYNRYYFHSCESLESSCTQDIIDKECAPEAAELLKNHWDLLEGVNCQGAEVFTVEEMEYYQYTQ